MNINREDKQAMHVSSSDQSLNYKIEHCEQYTYLGAIFTADGSTVSALRHHVQAKQKHVLKLVSFFEKNKDMPFRLKQKVFDACFLSAIIYGCES